MALQLGGVTVEGCWEQVSRMADFRGIFRPELDALVAFLLREGFLFEAGGLLSFGE
ncbi:MAG: hypothetical protein HY901_24150, partial [Deltaproteobacteria bacterium]|nr:hypothetical protein [Deltaproteobacteria bacterium]